MKEREIESFKGSEPEIGWKKRISGGGSKTGDSPLFRVPFRVRCRPLSRTARVLPNIFPTPLKFSLISLSKLAARWFSCPPHLLTRLVQYIYSPFCHSVSPSVHFRKGLKIKLAGRSHHHQSSIPLCLSICQHSSCISPFHLQDYRCALAYSFSILPPFRSICSVFNLSDQK